ncbi:MAG: DUF4097 family beta strand repeat-containing protein [Anaerolineae bacterium]
MKRTSNDFLDQLTQGLFSLFGPWSESVEELDWVFDGPVSLVRARTMNGSIVVRAANQRGATVRAWKTVRGPTEGLADAFRERVRVHVTQHGESLHVYSVYPQPPLGCSVFVRYEITVPRTVDIDLYVENGAIDISGTEGAIEAEVWSGSIELNESIGPADLYVSSGRIRARNAEGAMKAESGAGDIFFEDVVGDVRLRTTRGDLEFVRCTGALRGRSHEGGITVEDATGTVNLETDRGSIRASLLRLEERAVFLTQEGSILVRIQDGLAPVHMETLEGNVDLAVPPRFAGRVEAETGRGAIACELPLDIVEVGPHLLIARSDDDNGAQIKVHTFDGDISIHEFPAGGLNQGSKGDEDE